VTRSIYIVGGPGSGKSTLMAELLEGWEVGPYVRFTKREMFGHYMQSEEGLGAYLGHLRPDYPGTDALSLSVAPQALSWLRDTMPLMGLDWVFGEGARLSHMGFLTELAACTDLTVIYLHVDPEEAARRRQARGGKLLSESYCKIATSKARNVAAACREAGIRVEERSSGLG
jgi:hypothetical protein